MTEQDATTMLPEVVAAALGHLATAVTRLQAAAERRAGQRASQTDVEDELALMQEDRSRLAEDLDSARARAERLMAAQAAVAARLARAETAIAAALARIASPADGRAPASREVEAPQVLEPVRLRSEAR